MTIIGSIHMTLVQMVLVMCTKQSSGAAHPQDNTQPNPINKNNEANNKEQQHNRSINRTHNQKYLNKIQHTEATN
jgi:hypothetical protein